MFHRRIGFFLFVVFVLCLSFYTIKEVFDVQLQLPKEEMITMSAIDNNELNDIKEHIRIYNMKSKNNNSFECLKSKIVYSIQTTLCIHDPKRDAYVSKLIKGGGVWEEIFVNLFLVMLGSSNDINLFDFGAQLGEFTLFAAKLGRKVVAVEPFYDSYVRIHKAAQLENTQDRITLVTNGISDKRGELKRLTLDKTNTGGQSIFRSKSIEPSSLQKNSVKDPFIIETIILDDLITVLPKDFKKAIMKMDIEGMELRALTRASRLFETVNILAIMMEWTFQKKYTDKEISIFLDFMYNKGYDVSDPLSMHRLERENYRKWPNDLLWIKKGFKF